MIKIIRIILIFTLSFTINAQEKNEFFSLNYSLAEPSKFKNTNSEMGFKSLDTYLAMPTINVDKKIKINNILSYKFSEYDFLPDQSDDKLKSQLSEARLSVLLRYSFSEKKYLYILPQMIFRSDLEGKFKTKDFFPALYAIFYHTSKKNDKLKIGYGLAYSRDYFKNNVTPLLAFSYNSEKIIFDAILPGSVKLTFLPTKNWEYGLLCNLDTAIYRTDGESDAKYVRTVNIPLLLNISRKLDGIVWVNAKAGVSMIKDYGLLDSNFDLLKNQNHSLNSSAYFSVGISMRMDENKNTKF